MWAAYSSARRHGDTRISMLRSQWQCYLRAHILAECWPVAVASSAERTAKDGWVECVCRMLRPIRFVQVFVVDACSIHVVGRDIYHRESKGILFATQKLAGSGAFFVKKARCCKRISFSSSHPLHLGFVGNFLGALKVIATLVQDCCVAGAAGAEEVCAA